MFYHSDQEYVQGLVPFLVDGLTRAEPVAVAVPADRLAVLREALGADATRVHQLDMTEVGRNPGRIIAGVLRAFADAYPDRHVRIIGEPIWPGRSASEYPACVQHEALINTAFTGRDVTIACPYNVTQLDSRVLDDAQATHPLLWHKGRQRNSSRYAPADVLDTYNLPLPAPADAASFHATTAANLAGTRRFVLEQGRLCGLTPDQVGDLELIATELVSNSLVHAAGPIDVRIWPDEAHVICQGERPGTADRPVGRSQAPGGGPAPRPRLVAVQRVRGSGAHAHQPAGHHDPRLLRRRGQARMPATA